MSSEDRIRVWNEDTGRMIKPMTIEEIVRKLAPICGEPESDPFGHLVFMRNTGIYDTDGKEIFAEDLVTHSTEPWVYRVVQKRGCWWAMSLWPAYAQARILSTVFHPTIVGNVFENRELLTKGVVDE